MLTNSLILLLLVVITAALATLVRRAWRSSRPAVKWPGAILGGLATLLLVIVCVLGVKGSVTVYAPRGRPLRELHVQSTPERLARGQHIASAWCAACHTLNGQLPLSGGKNLSDEAGMPLGDLYTINLTPAGPLANWSDAEIFRAIRDGADNKRRRLLVMSAQRVRNLSNDDIEAVIAYLRSQPPVKHETPPPRPSFLTVLMAGGGMLPLLPGLAPETIVAPPLGATVEYGKYVAGWMGCDECHGANYTGGGGGVVPKGPNLRSVQSWTREGFIATMHTGKTPFGKQLDSLKMPWQFVGRLSNQELAALHAYLASLPD